MAAFTYDLATTVGEREVVALHPHDETGPYPPEVRHRIRRDVQQDYEFAAQQLNQSGVNVVSVQFEPEIWGGPGGVYVLDFVRALTVPFVVTLHSVNRNVSAEQTAILAELTTRAAVSVVMSRAAQAIAGTLPGVDTGRIELIPYGVPDLPLVAPGNAKAKLGMAGRQLILSFGHSGPGKGVESVIRAMPEVVDAFPAACYVILGAARPSVSDGEREAYELALEAEIAGARLEESVRRISHFAGRTELAKWLQAADVFVAPSRLLDRTVAGTIACAMAAGKAIVATQSAYAEEQLGEGCGRLLVTDTPSQMADAIVDLLRNRDLQSDMGRQAYDRSRSMVWWKVGDVYRRIFERLADCARPSSVQSIGRTPALPAAKTQPSRVFA